MVVTISTEQWLTWVVNAVLPALVALVAARNSHPALKAVLLLVFSAISSIIGLYIHASDVGAAITWQAAAFAVLSGYAVAVLSHFGLLSNGLTNSNGKIQMAAPGGLGDSKLG